MSQKKQAQTREERLAAKLRENLSRRKAQTRARKAGTADGEGGEGGNPASRGKNKSAD